MDLIFNILIAYVIFAFIILYTLGCGNSNFHKNGLVGKFNRFLNVGLPSTCSSVSSYLVPQPIKNLFNNFIEYFLYKPNRILQIAYLILVVGGSYLFMKDTYPYLNGYITPTYHKVGSILAIVITLSSFVLASVSDPGYITEDNHSNYNSKFKYDRILYIKKHCDTCSFQKPSRSKHCRVCDKCVARFDHHCPWINNCVGAKNLRYFLIFVGNTSLICFYCFYLNLCTLFTIIDTRNLLKLGYKQDGKWTPLPTSMLIRYLFAETKSVFPLGIFCFVISLFLLYFLCYHLYLVAVNKTTNETFKWSDIDDQIKLNRVNEKRRLKEESSSNKNNKKKTVNDNDDFDDEDQLNEFIENDTDQHKQQQQQSKQQKKQQKKRKQQSSEKKVNSHYNENVESVSIELPNSIKLLKNPFNRSLIGNFKEVFFP